MTILAHAGSVYGEEKDLELARQAALAPHHSA
jgi:hypothetical protein